jgi:MFS family permease
LFASIKRRPIFYGWWLAITALFVNALLSTPLYGAAGLWVNALEEEFGWTRTQLTIAFSLGQLEGSIMSPLVGYIIDKIGGKKLVAMGFIITAIGFLCLTQVTPITESRSEWSDPLLFYAAYMIITLGVSMGGWIPMTVIVNSWFEKRRSLALSLGSVGFSIGTFLIVPFMAIIIKPENLGWRATAVVCAIIFLLIVPAIWKLIVNYPEEIGEIPDGKASSKSISKTQLENDLVVTHDSSFTLNEALMSKAFWILALGHGSSVLLTSTMMIHLILALKAQGLTLEQAATVWGITMGIGGLAKLVGGFVGDHVSKRVAACAFGALQAVGVAFAGFADTFFLALTFAFVYGLGYGGRAPITMAMRGEYFAGKSFGKIMGISAVPMTFFSMIAPIVAGIFYDRSGSYMTVFILIAVTGFAGSLIFLLAKKPVSPSSVQPRMAD